MTMEQVNKWKDIISGSFNNIVEAVSEFTPKLVASVLVILVGLLIAQVIVKILKRVLKFIKADKLDDKLNEIELFGNKKLQFNIIKIVLVFVKWILYIFLLIIVAEMLDLAVVTQEVSKLLNYLPQLFSGLIILVFGLLLGNAVKKAIKSFFESAELSGSKIISQLVFTIILIFVSITALNQAGFNTDIITDNVTLIFGGFLLAFALAFGLGSRNIIEKLLKAYYSRRVFEVGQKVKMQKIEGEIEAINPTTVVIKSGNKKIVVPIEDLSDNQIEIHD